MYWKAAHAVADSAAALAAEATISFSVSPLDRSVVSGVEAIGAPPSFRDFAFFHDRIYISGATGLSCYDRGGTLEKTYRAGLELPPAELDEMAVANLGGASAGERLFIATDPEGLLSFDEQRFVRLADRSGKRRRSFRSRPGACCLERNPPGWRFGTDKPSRSSIPN